MIGANHTRSGGGRRLAGALLAAAALLAGQAGGQRAPAPADDTEELLQRLGDVLATFSPEVDFRGWAVTWLFGLEPAAWCWRASGDRQGGFRRAGSAEDWPDLLTGGGAPGAPRHYCFPRDIFALEVATRPGRGAKAPGAEGSQLRLFGTIAPAEAAPLAIEVPVPDAGMDALPRLLPPRGDTEAEETTDGETIETPLAPPVAEP